MSAPARACLAASGRHRRARVLAASSPLSPAFRRTRPRWIGEPRDRRGDRAGRTTRRRISDLCEWHELACNEPSSRRRGDRRNRLPCPAAGPAEPRCRDRQRRPSSGTDAVLGECLRARDLLRRKRHPSLAGPPQAWRDIELGLSARLSPTPPPRPAHRRDALRTTSRARASTATRSFRSSPTSSRGRRALEPEVLSRSRRRLRRVPRDSRRRDRAAPEFVDHDHGDACAVAVEYDAAGRSSLRSTCGVAVDW